LLALFFYSFFSPFCAGTAQTSATAAAPAFPPPAHGEKLHIAGIPTPENQRYLCIAARNLVK